MGEYVHTARLDMERPTIQHRLTIFMPVGPPYVYSHGQAACPFSQPAWAIPAEKITAAAIFLPPSTYLTTFYNWAELGDQISFYH